MVACQTFDGTSSEVGAAVSHGDWSTEELLSLFGPISVETSGACGPEAFCPFSGVGELHQDTCGYRRASVVCLMLNR